MNDTVRLQYAESPGAFLSLEETLPEIVRRTLFIFGALGNVIDRLTRDGSVVDFLNVGIGSVRTGIFNVADMALLVGVALLIYASGHTRDSKFPVQRQD